MEIRILESPTELKVAYEILHELRTDLSITDFLRIYEAARDKNGYTIVAVMEKGEMVAIMGYRILHDFVHGKHLYVDDLVVTESKRSSGIGAKLLSHAEELAKKESCAGLRLCTGKANEKAIRFYEREGWNPRSIAFKKTLPRRPVIPTL